jgi:hypothetical protein
MNYREVIMVPKNFCLVTVWLVALLLGMVEIASSEDVNQTEAMLEDYQLRKQRIIDYWAGRPLTPDPKTKMLSYETQAEAALARLVKGIDLANANNYFEHTPRIDPSQFEDNFTYTFWIRAYLLFKDSSKLTSAAKSNMRSLIGRWRDMSPSGTENHSQCIAGNAYLARQIYGDDLADIRTWLINRFTDRAKRGWIEVNSPSYENLSMWGIWNLVDFAEDPVIRKFAEMTLDWMLAEYALENLNQYRCGPFHRGYRTSLDSQNYIGGAYLLGSYAGDMHVVLTSYRVPEVILDIATDKRGKGCYEFKGRRRKGNLYYWVTPEYVLACAQYGSSLGGIGIGGVERVRYGDQKWNLSFGTDPRAVIHSNSEGRPSQYENLLVINTGGKPLIYAPLLGREFEIREVDGNWTFIKEGGAYAAIRTIKNSLYLLEVCLASDYSSFTHFKDDIKSNRLSGTESYTYTSTKEDAIEFTDRIIKVNGRSYDTSDYKLFDSPFVNSEWDSGYVIIRKGARELILDFRDRANPRRIITK